MGWVWIEYSRTGSLLSEWIFNLKSKQQLPLLALSHFHRKLHQQLRVLALPGPPRAPLMCLDDVHQNPWMPSASIEDWLVSRRSTTVKSAATPRVTTCTRSRWCLHPVGALWQGRHAKFLEDLLRSLCPSEGYHGLLPRIS